MPHGYASQAQQGLFHSPNSPVSPAEVAKWDAESKGVHGLPKHVKPHASARSRLAKALALHAKSVLNR